MGVIWEFSTEGRTFFVPRVAASNWLSVWVTGLENQSAQATIRVEADAEIRKCIVFCHHPACK